MSSNQPPRFELPVTDGKGRITREWYRYLVNLGNSQNNSATSSDDLQNFQNLDSAGAESIALTALNIANKALANDGQFLLGQDQPQKPDNDLLAFWPGNTI